MVSPSPVSQALRYETPVVPLASGVSSCKFISFFFKYLFFYFTVGCTGSSCFVQAFSSCGRQGLLSSCDTRLLIAVASLVVEQTGSRRGASEVAAHGLSCPAACGIFLDQIPVSPTLAGTFLAIGSPGKSQS